MPLSRDALVDPAQPQKTVALHGDYSHFVTMPVIDAVDSVITTASEIARFGNAMTQQRLALWLRLNGND